ncbi:general substrate transporter [Mycena albidolilacea]|uniref:General substrate transporter n=1 Tax=Mycena albidolilacea TaxID=1033008 RepID=A0AAD6Z1V7_9AGAR|nr:general substrate transporter [Mycena albidolilacea]
MAPTQHIFKNIRVYWLAFVVYWGIILFGGGVVSAPFFLQQFGLLNPDGSTNKQRNADVSSNVVSVLQAGAFFGALGSAPISAKIGRKTTLLGFTFMFLVGAILTTVANGHHGLSEIYGGRVILGFGIGGISAVSPAFVSECSPKEVRGRITGLFQIFVAIGVMMSYWVNYGISVHVKPGPKLWQIPFGIQLIPAGVMGLGLLTVKESPRWLASVGRTEEAIANLAYLRKEPESSEAVIHEMAEIEAQIQEEREARQGLGVREAFLGKGNFIRFVIAFCIFFLQQWSGQNSVNYYAPQIFASIGYTGRRNGLLATGVYGVVKVVATSIFVFFGVEWLGRKASLFISAMGMGTCFFIVGAILKTHPPPAVDANTVVPESPASKGMAAMLYIYVCFYSMGWGPLPWVYCADIFPTRTRHYGMAVASASQWLWNFTLSKTTPQMVLDLGYKIFLMFATINIAGMGVFSLLIPETKGRSLEDMDIIFGAVAQEKRNADIAKQEQAMDKQHHHDDEGSAGDEKA